MDVDFLWSFFFSTKWLNFSADDAAGISGDATGISDDAAGISGNAAEISDDDLSVSDGSLSVSEGALSISDCSTVGFKGAASIGVIGKAVSEAASSSVDAVSCF